MAFCLCYYFDEIMTRVHVVDITVHFKCKNKVGEYHTRAIPISETKSN